MQQPIPDLAKVIDHTFLRPDGQKSDIDRLCREAKHYGFYAVCLYPAYISYAKSLLKNTPTNICTVVGFPHGATTTQIKEYETRKTVEEGADEIDMVINIGALKDKRYDFVKNEIYSVVKAAAGRVVKVIIETSLLSINEKITASKLCVDGGAHFIKTSTGFAPSKESDSAKASDVALIRKAIGQQVGIKASGGIRNVADAQKMLAAGATRLGTSSSVSIMSGLILP
ncbi:MAG: deoxyribose-phosphate aldolase [Bdellovibrionota bacterium]